MQKFFTSNWYENLMNCLFFWKDITGMIEPCSPGGPKTEQQQAIEKEKEGMSMKSKKITAILMAAGMHCVNCMAAAGETLEEAAAVHGLDPKELEDEINDYLEKKGE